MFGDSEAVYGWLGSFINLERGLGGKPGEHFKLERMRILAELAGNPEQCAPVIHIAGSKGKGSVCAMTAALLEAAGKRPGRYMSPHVSDWRERICLGRAFFPEAAYIEAGNELQAVYDKYNAFCKRLQDIGLPGEPTFFELFTLYFFLCARLARCDVLSVETGLGGKLDATNIVSPLVSVITVIEKEHTEYLGDTIEKIAGEKAGIIKNNRPVILTGQENAALETFTAVARENNSPLLYVPEYCSVSGIELKQEGTAFSLDFSSADFWELSARYTVPVPGAVQAYNAAIALMAAKTAAPALNVETAKTALTGFSLPARFERISVTALGQTETVFIVDGAHTPGSVERCAQTFCGLYGEGGVLVFGCAKEKDIERMAELLVPRFSTVIVTAPGNFRASDPEAAYTVFQKAASRSGVRVTLVPDTTAAITKALRAANEQKLPLLGCGSFYLAGEIRKLLANPRRSFS